MYKQILNEAFNSVIKNKNVLFKALAINLGLLIIINYLRMNYFQSNLQNISDSIFVILLALFTLMININIAITTHRVLLNEEVPTWGFFQFSKREFKFFFMTISLSLITAVIAILLALIPYVGIFLAGFAVIILMSRLSLVFPSIAIDKAISFKQSWEYTKNHKLLAASCLIIFPFIIFAIVGAVYAFLIYLLATIVSFNVDFLVAILNIILTVFAISFLSTVYKYLVKNSVENIV